MDAIKNSAGEPRALKLVAQVRQTIRARHFSRRTEQSYVGWVRRFVRYHGLRHPADLGERDVSRFLSSLAAEHGVAAATQKQAAAGVYSSIGTFSSNRWPGSTGWCGPRLPTGCRSC